MHLQITFLSTLVHYVRIKEKMMPNFSTIIFPETHERLSIVFMKLLQPLNDGVLFVLLRLKDTIELRNLEVIALIQLKEFSLR